MGLEQQKQKTLSSAERLLRQGKIQEALVVLERMAASTSSDQLTLNRMGDLLTRFGRKEEAISYYFRIAVEFTQAGFYPKAVAIHKKILRLNPDNIDSLVSLGELYLQRRLPAEARVHHLRAAELYLQSRNFTAALEIYEKLAAAEPDDPRHRVRLAEAMAAAGDGERAGDELLSLAESLLKSGRSPDAERTYRRAAELLPDRIEPMLGICDSLVAQGQEIEALQILEKASEGDGAKPAVMGALALIYERTGRKEKTVELLGEASASEIPGTMMQNLFRFRLEAGDIDEFWNRVEPSLQSWVKAGKSDKLAELYRQLAAIEEHGHIPAIERWRDVMIDGGNDSGTAGALEALLQAYQARDRESEAARIIEELKRLAPESAVLTGTAPKAGVGQPTPSPDAPAADDSAAERGYDDSHLAAEAPAVPINRSDVEYVAGRLTQAEILEKYGLHDQALQQVREVIEKYPGHVPAQEKLVRILRSTQDKAGLKQALVGLAVALKAMGNTAEACRAVAEARRISPFDDKTIELLNRMEILEPPAARPAPEPPAALEAVAPPVDSEEEQVILIDFDDVEEDEEEEKLPVIQPPVIAPVKAVVTAAPAVTPAIEAGAIVDKGLDDLSAITAALEGEVFTEEARPHAAEAEAEQSLEEVFATFKKHVAEEVDSEDFRTHYDLGIAYKEMGFLEEAINEFEHAAGAPDLEREVPTMLGMCYRQMGKTEQAAGCYRRAIELAGEETAPLCELRYELADMLAESGDTAGALELFQTVFQDDPSFRDVSDRVAALEAVS